MEMPTEMVSPSCVCEAESFGKFACEIFQRFYVKMSRTNKINFLVRFYGAEIAV